MDEYMDELFFGINVMHMNSSNPNLLIG